MTAKSTRYVSALKSFSKAVLREVFPEKVLSEYRREMELEQSNVDNSVLIVILDACRYDTFKEAYEGEFPSELHKAYSTCCWTLPSHESIIRGMLPFNQDIRPQELLVNDYVSGFYPMPLQHSYSFGLTSLMLLSKSKVVKNKMPDFFDYFECFQDTQCSEELLEEAKTQMDKNEDFFGLINLGETHFPYDHYEEDFESFVEDIEEGTKDFEQVKQKQGDAAKKLISKIQDLRSEIPEGTQVVVTSDHGEILGEHEAYGHNPRKKAIFDEKLFEVPLISWVEGK